ncbi:MAG TPA: phage regulatory CII family protein, partial [Alphaproteobacteria bacterium]|nr:phage regulatory CII family protein [Alphaproteobacteria bacterium]
MNAQGDGPEGRQSGGRSRIHSFHPEGYGDVKTAVRALLHALGGETRAAALCRVSKSTLSEYGNPRYADRHMPVDVVLALEKAAGEMPVSEHLAAEHDAVLLKLPQEEAAETVWIDHLSAIGKEAGDVFHRAGEFLANDGDIDAREAPLLLREVDELLAAVAAMRTAVRRRLP